MLWALLAILGVPVWLVVGALGGALISRRQFTAQPGVFHVAVREHGSSRWPHRLAYGRYVHDVLLVNSGLALVRTSIRVVERVAPLEFDEPPAKLHDPVGWSLTLVDGERVDIAVGSVDAELVAPREDGRASARSTTDEADPDRRV